ncbi:hypothetical protein CWI38_1351p0030 [Hamiltosporidium tvaerminnensis]|uniref:Uncharacterized protein n=1 Tax=Hamiltosporidium tvaerminnensis TaxID=1176355 RepID=A0A4Q9LRK9_9MICR|nr:hypothetical protein CWI38_1351p0030 [Hamiltosporidium tvaerminnensis]
MVESILVEEGVSYKGVSYKESEVIEGVSYKDYKDRGYKGDRVVDYRVLVIIIVTCYKGVSYKDRNNNNSNVKGVSNNNSNVKSVSNTTDN